MAVGRPISEGEGVSVLVGVDRVALFVVILVWLVGETVGGHQSCFEFFLRALGS